MRIIHIYARKPHPRIWGERVDVRFWKMSEWLHNNGFDVAGITKGEKSERKYFEGIETFRVPSRGIADFALKVSSLLLKLDKEKGIDIIHGHRHSGVLPALIAKKLGLKSSVIFDYHDPWSGESHMTEPNLWQRLKTGLFRHLEGFIARNCDHIFVVTEFQADILAKKHGLSKSKFTVVYNMAKKDVFKPSLSDKEKFGFTGKKIVFFVGSIVPYFGIHLLVDAASLVVKKVPNAVFVIKGVFHDKDYGEKIMKQIRDNGLAKHFIIIKEWLDEEKLAAMMASADIAAIMHMPTLLTETASPDKLYEYLASGLPVVSTNLKNLRKWVLPKKTGLLAHHNPEDIAQAIIKLLTDDDLRKMISKNARRLCENKWNWDNEMGKVESVYQKLAKGNHSKRLL
ncbi:MAG: glycosyltransferase family 4 protein [Candidatus Aenigmarchaeota archaeon]|nr:glycosyltransferase family 4 protein [Candidatus Aenigmarchaeota archaeon]